MKKTDINGIEMKTGDIVEVKNAFFKNDNGIYFIAHTPGDPTWCGNDYSLRKMCKNGKISISSKNIAFWPLSAFTNNREKNRECRKWNEANATIEVIFTIDNTAVVEHFRNEANITKKQYDRDILYYGECSQTDTDKEIYEFYFSLVAEMEPKEQRSTEIPGDHTISEDDKLQPETRKDEQPEEKELAKAEIIERKYYSINEKTARWAKEMNSFSDFTNGEATETYKHYCDKVYDVLDQIREQRPQLAKKAESMTDRYCRKLAEYYNDYYRNEASCPSIMISGGSKFPVNKKNKQNSRRETLNNTWNYLKEYAEKINHLLTQEQPILSGDKDVIEQLEAKINQLEEEHKHKLYCNNYYKKHGTLKGCEGLTEKEIDRIEDFITRNPFFPPFIVCNDTANIRRYKARLDKLRRTKESESKEEITTDQEGNELFKVLENTEIMRLQLFFDEKPDERTRNILKKNGFKWAPTHGAWQRQLTENARYSLKRVKEALTA